MMHETDSDLRRLQRVLDVSHERAGSHLRSVITPERMLTAVDLAARLTGMKLLALATVNSLCAPVVGPVDGIFYRGEFWFGTSPSALRIRHIRQNTAVSATHLEGEEFAVTVHGTAHIEGVPADLPGGLEKSAAKYMETAGSNGVKERSTVASSRGACSRSAWRRWTRDEPGCRCQRCVVRIQPKGARDCSWRG